MIREKKSLARRQRREVSKDQQMTSADDVVDDETSYQFRKMRLTSTQNTPIRRQQQDTRSNYQQDTRSNYQQDTRSNYQQAMQSQPHNYHQINSSDRNQKSSQRRKQNEQQISNGVAFGRTVKYVNRAQTADQQDPSLSKYQSSDSLNEKALSLLRRHHSICGYGYKQRQQSAPSQNPSRPRSLTQQYNIGYGHKILTRQDNPTINISRFDSLNRHPSNQVPRSPQMLSNQQNALKMGRKLVSGSNKNAPSSGSAKQRLGSYPQKYSVINQSALTAIGVGGKK